MPTAVERYALQNASSRASNTVRYEAIKNLVLVYAAPGYDPDRLYFDARQKLLRLVIERVTITGWRLEIHLKIPLHTPTGGTHLALEAVAGRQACATALLHRLADEFRRRPPHGLAALRNTA